MSPTLTLIAWLFLPTVGFLFGWLYGTLHAKCAFCEGQKMADDAARERGEKDVNNEHR